MALRIGRVLFVAALVAGCGKSEGSSEKKAEAAENGKAEPAAEGASDGPKRVAKKKKKKNDDDGPRDRKYERALIRLDEIAEKLGELVEQGDLKGLRALWVEPGAFEDCHVAEANLEPGEAAAKRDELLARFDGTAKAGLAEEQRGEVFFINRWGDKRPTGMGGRFVGDDCRVQYFARVNVVVRPAKAPNSTVEHRFDLLMVDGVWKLQDYELLQGPCGTGEEESYGCARLREHLAENG